MGEIIQPKFKLGDTLYQAVEDPGYRAPIREFVVYGIISTETDGRPYVMYCDRSSEERPLNADWFDENTLFLSAEEAALYLLKIADRETGSKKDFILDTLRELEK